MLLDIILPILTTLGGVLKCDAQNFEYLGNFLQQKKPT